MTQKKITKRQNNTQHTNDRATRIHYKPTENSDVPEG